MMWSIYSKESEELMRVDSVCFQFVCLFVVSFIIKKNNECFW